MLTQEPQTKGQRTRDEIIRRAAPVFNKRGFAGASMADIVAAVGIEKGGIYNHFKSKEELAFAVFEWAVAQMEARHAARYVRSDSRYDNLISAIRAFAATAIERPIEGGCPLINTAVESDDTNPAMRERVRAVFARWCAAFTGLIRKAIEAGELSSGVDPESLGTAIVSSLEGALLISNVSGTDAPMHQAAGMVEALVASKRLRKRARKTVG